MTKRMGIQYLEYGPFEVLLGWNCSRPTPASLTFFAVGRRYTESAARQIMLRILNAVQYLHARDIVSNLFAFAVALHLCWGSFEPRRHRHVNHTLLLQT